MEIAVLTKNSVRLKGKNASFVVNPESSPKESNGSFYFTFDPSRKPISEEGVILDSPGEFEVAGVKIKGESGEKEMTFSIRMDGITILVGQLSLLEKIHGKLQEHNLVLVHVDKLIDPSFVSPFATSAVLYFGQDTLELGKSFLKDETQSMSKFVVTKDKLPQEMVTVLLQ